MNIRHEARKQRKLQIRKAPGQIMEKIQVLVKQCLFIIRGRNICLSVFHSRICSIPVCEPNENSAYNTQIIMTKLGFPGYFVFWLACIPGLTEAVIPMEWRWPYPSKVTMVSLALSAWRCKVCVVLSNFWGRYVPLFTAADLSKSCTSEYETAKPNLFSCWTMNLLPVTCRRTCLSQRYVFLLALRDWFAGLSDMMRLHT